MLTQSLMALDLIPLAPYPAGSRKASKRRGDKSQSPPS
jgi:hypothetical protein